MYMYVPAAPPRAVDWGLAGRAMLAMLDRAGRGSRGGLGLIGVVGGVARFVIRCPSSRI